MISYDEAFALLLADLSPTEPETVPLALAQGRVLAAPITAQRTQPPTRTSAMDGFAVRAASLTEAKSRLRIMGESAAGHPLAKEIGLGAAARISTGAAVPPGADQVVVREQTSVAGEVVTVDARPQPGANIRPAGVDFSLGDVVVAPGRRLGAAGVALGASACAAEIVAHRRPRVAVLSTGDELVEPGEPLGDHQIVNSNSIAVAVLVREAGGEPLYLGIARDDPESVRALCAKAVDLGADLLVTIGGASAGDHDHVRRVFTGEGGSYVFDQIAVKPGKPTWYGRMRGLPVLGLPGNPVSALLQSHLLLLPALRRLQGEAGAARLPWRTLPLAGELRANPARETFLRGALVEVDGAAHARALANQDSAALSAFVAADVLIRRPADAPALKDGDLVEALPL